jgi:N utilization substance protein B
MGTRRKSRELALQMLFQSDMGKQDAEQVRRTFWAEHGTTSAEVRGFADDLFRPWIVICCEPPSRNF